MQSVCAYECVVFNNALMIHARFSVWNRILKRLRLFTFVYCLNEVQYTSLYHIVSGLKASWGPAINLGWYKNVCNFKNFKKVLKHYFLLKLKEQFTKNTKEDIL